MIPHIWPQGSGDEGFLHGILGHFAREGNGGESKGTVLLNQRGPTDKSLLLESPAERPGPRIENKVFVARCGQFVRELAEGLQRVGSDGQRTFRLLSQGDEASALPAVAA